MSFITNFINRLIAWALGNVWFRNRVKQLMWFPRRFDYTVSPAFVKVGKNAPSSTCLLQFGDHVDSRPGAFFEAKVWLSSRRHSGHVQFVQDIVMDRKMDGRANGRQGDFCLTTNGVKMLDKTDPYYEEQVSGRGPNGTGPISVLNSDSPAHSLLNKEILEITEQYRMFLMWRPARFGGRFRVPLAKIEWSWHGKAIAHDPNDNPDCKQTHSNGIEFGWKLVSLANEHTETGSTPTTELPVTSPNVQTVFDAGWQDC